MPGCACSQLWIATDLLQRAFLFAGADDLSHRRNLAANFEDVAGLQYLNLFDPYPIKKRVIEQLDRLGI